jgi:hypothetical protein
MIHMTATNGHLIVIILRQNIAVRILLCEYCCANIAVRILLCEYCCANIAVRILLYPNPSTYPNQKKNVRVHNTQALIAGRIDPWSPRVQPPPPPFIYIECSG